MVSYQNQLRSLKQRVSGDRGKRPGSLSSPMAGNVFIQLALFEVNSPLK